MQTAPAPPRPPEPPSEPSMPPEIRWAPVPAPLYRKFLSFMIAVAPALVAVFVAAQMIGGSVPWLNLLLLTVFYFVIAHGVTIGFHRCFTHRSFEACRPLKITLALLGSMSAREVFVSTLGQVAAAESPDDPHEALVSLTDDDGHKVFTAPTVIAPSTCGP